MKHRFINYLYFTRKERFGTMVLLALCIGIFCVPSLLPLFQEKTVTDFSDFEAAIQSFKQSNTAAPPRPTDLFVFDPNEATPDDFIRLGLSEKTARNIDNYRKKGGRFRKPEDFKKIWGLQPADYERLQPYIRLQQETTHRPGGAHPAFTAIQDDKKPTYAPFYPKYKPKTAPSSPLDLNHASAEELAQLPMIGEKRAAQITGFRQRLGGFLSVEQLAEMYNLPDSVFQTIRPYLSTSPNGLQPLNLNQVSAETLEAHPYISKKQADLIIAYRQQHGPFQTAEDVLKIKAFTDKNWWSKVAPYLSVH